MKPSVLLAHERAQQNEARRLRWRAERERTTERRRLARELARYWSEVADTQPFLPRRSERSRQMAVLRAQGQSFRAIGMKFGLSRQRSTNSSGHTSAGWVPGSGAVSSGGTSSRPADPMPHECSPTSARNYGR
jgi:hypothetical protein